MQAHPEFTPEVGKELLKAQTNGVDISEVGRGDTNWTYDVTGPTHPLAILKALTLYCQGYSYEEVRYILHKTMSVERSLAEILKWVRAYNPPYLVATSNHARHQTVEDYMLCCDRNTVAVEVPVYLYDKRLGSIAGHIDLIQVSGDRISVLDYKPNAAKENPGKVVTQLTLYANALALRTRTPLQRFDCAYFDESETFYFDPPRLDRVDLSSAREAATSFETFHRDRVSQKQTGTLPQTRNSH